MEPEPLAELLEIAQALRAHLDWQAATGTSALPRSERAPEALQASADRVEESAQSSERAAVAPSAPSMERAAESFAASAPSSADRMPSLKRPSESDGPVRPLRLEILLEEARACTRCGLHKSRQQAVFARGTGSSGLCFVGEGPGADEDFQGYPFVGAAGQLLDRMIGAMGFSREEVYVCNIVKCRPPNNRKPDLEEMAACSPFLIEQLELIGPQVIVALGATAVQGLLGTSDGITRLRGKWKLYKGRIAVMPTFHPAYLLRTPAAKREVWDDLQAVLRQMGRSAPERSRQ